MVKTSRERVPNESTRKYCLKSPHEGGEMGTATVRRKLECSDGFRLSPQRSKKHVREYLVYDHSGI